MLPIRPSSASGEYVVRSVRYITSTSDWATPATNATASRTGIWTDRDSTIRARPMVTLPPMSTWATRLRPIQRALSERADDRPDAVGRQDQAEDRRLVAELTVMSTVRAVTSGDRRIAVKDQNGIALRSVGLPAM